MYLVASKLPPLNTTIWTKIYLRQNSTQPKFGHFTLHAIMQYVQVRWNSFHNTPQPHIQTVTFILNYNSSTSYATCKPKQRTLKTLRHHICNHFIRGKCLITTSPPSILFFTKKCQMAMWRFFSLVEKPILANAIVDWLESPCERLIQQCTWVIYTE